MPHFAFFASVKSEGLTQAVVGSLYKQDYDARRSKTIYSRSPAWCNIIVLYHTLLVVLSLVRPYLYLAFTRRFSVHFTMSPRDLASGLAR